MDVLYVRVSFAPVEFLVSDSETLMGGAGTEIEGMLLVGIDPDKDVVGYQPTTSNGLGHCGCISSTADPSNNFNCESMLIPSHNTGSHGVISISCFFQVKHIDSNIGLHKPGTTPPVKTTGNGY
jgi:hypothetical protein